MNEKLKINIVSGLMGAYGLFVLVNALVYYFLILPGETDIFRGIIRATGSFFIAYYLYKKHKFAYWIALVFSGILSVLGIFGIIMMMNTKVVWTNYLFSIPIVIFVFIFFILIQKKVRLEFK